MSVTPLQSFEVESKPDNIFVAHLPREPLEGLEIAALMEEAAPIKQSAGNDFRGLPRYVSPIVSQYGSAGVFEGDNSHILRAHRVAFGEAWARAYTSAQMIRFCLEPLMGSPSMHGPTLKFPYDWNHRNDKPVETIDELLEFVGNFDSQSGVSAANHFLARVLGIGYSDYGRASEWLQLRSSALDGPINIRVPGSFRDARQSLRPPVIEPKLVWQEIEGQRVAIDNAEAGLETRSEPHQLIYQDGTVGLIIAATRLGVPANWPTRYGFKQEHLDPKKVRKGTIEMEASQVPLLAQVSANNILNHPEFKGLLAN